MANIERLKRKRKSSKKEGNRLYTLLDMAIIKKDVAITNAKRKRKELDNHPNQYISVCGCGMEGCFIHGSFETVDREFYR